jgi:RNA polymerase subunit RPABC4/transcription elongation factor Spt4
MPNVCFETGAFRIINLTSFSLLSLAMMILWIAVIVWVYRDAERRGMNGVLWALLVFIGNIIALLIYLIVRSDSVPPDAAAAQSCPECQKSVSPNHVFCPYCGTRLQAVCPSCEKPVDREWQVCPNCGKKLTEKGKT